MDKHIFLFVLSLFVMCACSKKETPEEKGIGYLNLNISQDVNQKVDVELTDFILRINDTQGAEVSERIGDLPDQIVLPVGSYTVEAYSTLFSNPQFETPCYNVTSDTECVFIELGAATTQYRINLNLIDNPGNLHQMVVIKGDLATYYSRSGLRSLKGYLFK